jgi:hypothetical protein
MLEVTLPGVYRDPWNQDYRVVIDADYSGSITAGVRGLASTVSSSVVVWSKGPDTADDATANNSTNKDNIYTVVTNWSNGGHVLR